MSDEILFGKRTCRQQRKQSKLTLVLSNIVYLQLRYSILIRLFFEPIFISRPNAVLFIDTRELSTGIISTGIISTCIISTALELCS